MIPRPDNRAVQSGHIVTRDAARSGGQVAGVSGITRKAATIRDVLGRDPNANVMTGGTGLIELPSANSLLPK